MKTKTTKDFRPIFRPMPLVIVLMPMALKVCRDMMDGIWEYVQIYGPWRLDILEERIGEQKYGRVKNVEIAGIIAYLHSPENVLFVRKTCVPTVLIDPLGASEIQYPKRIVGEIVNRTEAVGRLAAEHFLEKKFTHFAYIGDSVPSNWSIKRGESFAKYLADAGYSCHFYPISTASNVGRERESNAIGRWLRKQPKPLGVLAARDIRGHQILDACLQENISVPHEISVLGVDNDLNLCRSTYPTMSSIQMETHQAGFLAAQMLDEILKKGQNPGTWFYGPGTLIPRASTDCLQVTDPCVMQAIEFIRLHADHGINVADVVRALGYSRRKLEMHFQEHLHRSVLSEIKRVQIQRVQQLLRKTELPFSEIARICGFRDESYLGKFFKSQTGNTMTQFRRK